jgi:anti-sigma regulatory factor (Ser/Thr protein kinase)
MSGPPDLDERFAAVPESIASARSRLADFAANLGASDRQVEDVRLAVSEAVTNAVLHGYRGTPGIVRVTATADPRGTLVVTVHDAGCGAHPGPPRPGLGLGLGLIADAADDMAIVPHDGGTELRMWFALARVAVLA